MGLSCPAITLTISCSVLFSAAPGCCGHVGIPASGPGNNRWQIYCFLLMVLTCGFDILAAGPRDAQIYGLCVWPRELLRTVGLAGFVAAWTLSIVAVCAVYVPAVCYLGAYVDGLWLLEFTVGTAGQVAPEGGCFCLAPQVASGSSPRMSGMYNR